MTTTKKPLLDVIGDVHGQLEVLEDLGRRLGYDVDAGWAHEEGRVLVFLGDLVDRGPDSLGVVQLVERLVATRRAHCLMGNHEFNLLEQWVEEGRREWGRNPRTKASIDARPDEWEAVKGFLAELPLAMELPGLRMVHACWHRESVERCVEALPPQSVDDLAGDADTWELLRRAIVVGSPFTPSGRKPGIPAWNVDDSHCTCAEVLIKGLESPELGPVVDAGGKTWSNARVGWWDGKWPAVATEVPVVFGHYWHLPPNDEASPLAPVEVLGSERERAHVSAEAPKRPPHGRLALGEAARHVCVDFNGMQKGGPGACVGAYRWPERELMWSSG